MNENKFEWTDELVKEFTNSTGTSMPTNDLDIQYFKQSKLAPPPVKERIEIDFVDMNAPRTKDMYSHTFTTNHPLNDYKKIREAIEAALNEDTVVPDNDELVGLLRDCVSSTWGNPSLTETQLWFDKFLHDRKLAKPSQQLLNSFITDAVNRNMYDKKYSQKEVDAMMLNVWNAARELKVDGKRAVYTYWKFEDYKNSYPSNQPPQPTAADTGKEGWEILTCFDNPGVSYNLKGWHDYYPKDGKVDRLSNCDEEKCKIKSVRRLSDNCVFTVGDNYGSVYKITSFKIMSGEMMYECNGNDCYYNINTLRPSTNEKLPPKEQSKPVTDKPMFEEAIRVVINSYSIENRSDTPDYILAQYISDCLSAYEKAIKYRKIQTEPPPVPASPIVDKPINYNRFLFITDDGVNIYEGMKYYFVSERLTVDYYTATYGTIPDRKAKRFYNKENAEKYISENKPQPTAVVEDKPDWDRISNCVRDKCAIHSVRRLINNRIISVGDNTTKGKIARIEKTDQHSYYFVFYMEEGSFNPDYPFHSDEFETIPEPLPAPKAHVTWAVNKETFQIVKTIHALDESYDWVTFSSKELAEKWVEENKPKEQSKPVLFTTEDGVGIKEGDSFCYIDHRDNWKILKLENINSAFGWFHPLDTTLKTFSTKDVAKQYCIDNKPCLCRNEVMEIVRKIENGTNGHDNRSYINNELFSKISEKLKQ